ncbi:putative Altered inheritance of mitochondria protein 31, mitochondrial [Venustampulla echinocandica]|uniref:Putative Altered inheritance of mitochondria protein 31, mitochondrial n=1 Tax=Venustampulla echinocandica TaxID=2656787 RepID=A0A370TB83_9HELO|nr:putative Altered inheritance of mitochondria protein 31, mitochondrial [Venustampulla echinocandica]RDL31178.1 putative Altered inheritance of mitochondria protein 31, mitochondrial [Venustampulla echinocandica]
MSNAPLPSSFDGNADPANPDRITSDFYEENRWQKLSRRLKEEPLVPLGCLLTCAALLGASRSIRSGDHNKTNRMFRARILAQGFTLVAMVAGSVYWAEDREKRKEFEGILSEKKQKEKNEAWIKELEARDREEKEIAALREKRRARAMDGAHIPEKVKTKVPEAQTTAEAAMENPEEKGKGILDKVYGMVSGRPNKEQPSGNDSGNGEPKPPRGGAKSMMEDEDQRRRGVFEMVQELVASRR